MPRQYIPRAALTCKQCGGAFEVKAYRATTAQFCSRACKGLARQAIGDLASEFWARVPRAGDGCWLWPGSGSPENYGRFWHRTRAYDAHRLAYELTRGSIPPDLCVCHTCDTPACCRPDHLFLGTKGDNARDRAAKGRSAGGERHPRWQAKLTADLVREMRRLREDHGTSFRGLGAKFGVNEATAYKAVTGRIWRHVA